MFSVIGSVVYAEHDEQERFNDLTLADLKGTDQKIIQWINERDSINILHVSCSCENGLGGMLFPKIRELYLHSEACTSVDFWLNFIDQHKKTLKKVSVDFPLKMNTRVDVFDQLEELELHQCCSCVSSLTNLKTLRVQYLDDGAEICKLIERSQNLSTLEITFVKNLDQYDEELEKSMEGNVSITSFSSWIAMPTCQMFAARNKKKCSACL